MRQATAYANQIAQDENDHALEAVKKSGKTTVYTPTKEERAALKKALVPVHQKMAGRIGKDIIQDVYKATGFDPPSCDGSRGLSAARPPRSARRSMPNLGELPT
jgi:C4-dicarboxylate-binding protein DctP